MQIRLPRRRVQSKSELEAMIARLESIVARPSLATDPPETAAALAALRQALAKDELEKRRAELADLLPQQAAHEEIGPEPAATALVASVPDPQPHAPNRQDGREELPSNGREAATPVHQAALVAVQAPPERSESQPTVASPAPTIAAATATATPPPTPVAATPASTVAAPDQRPQRRANWRRVVFVAGVAIAVVALGVVLLRLIGTIPPGNGSQLAREPPPDRVPLVAAGGAGATALAPATTSTPAPTLLLTFTVTESPVPPSATALPSSTPLSTPEATAPPPAPTTVAEPDASAPAETPAAGGAVGAPSASTTPDAPDAAIQGEAQQATIRLPVGFTAALLRAAPSTAAPTLATLASGTTVEVLPETAEGNGFDWIKVRIESGLEGWVVNIVVQ